VLCFITTGLYLLAFIGLVMMERGAINRSGEFSTIPLHYTA
jgi:hypothetical protein